MRGVYGKVLMLVALGIATSTVTSTVVARLKTKKSQGTQAAAAPKAQVEPAAKKPAVLPATSGGVSIKSMTVGRFGDNGFRIRGQAHVKVPSHPDMRFVWTVRILDPATQSVIADRRYEEQIFQTPRDTHELSPTFDDAIVPDLPKGQYKLQLMLHEVPSGGAALLDNPDLNNAHLLAKKTVQVLAP